MSKRNVLLLSIPLVIVLLLALTLTLQYGEEPTRADDGIPDATQWFKLQTEMPSYSFLATPVPMVQRTYIDDPANYQIVYLSAPGAISDNSLIAPTGLIRSAMQAGIAHSWSDVQQFQSQRPIQAIIIHKSAAGMVDPVWLRAAGRDGMVIVLINMHYAEFAELIDSNCDRIEAQSAVNPFEGTGDYFYLTVGLSLANNPAEQPLVDAAVYDTCVRNPAITGGVRAWGTAGHDLIDADYKIGNLTDMIIGTISMVQTQRQAYNNRGRPATPVPGFSN